VSDKEKTIQAIVAGHLCLDLNAAFAADGGQSMKDILIPGKLINMGQVTLSTGGAVSNTGISLRMLGIDTRLMGKIGSDLLGGVVENILRSYGAEDGLIVDPAASTSYSVVIAPPGVDRIFLHHTGANDTFCTKDLNLDQIAAARLFHFGYPPLMRQMYADGGVELARMFQTVRDLDVTTSLDLALPDPASAAGQADWQEILSRVLPLTDVFLPSLEELLYMLDRPCFDKIKAEAGDRDLMAFYDFSRLPALAARLIDMGVKIVVIKLGRRGYYIRTAERSRLAAMGPAKPADLDNWSSRELQVEIFDVRNIASTSGAGDASIAGFLAGLLTGRSVEMAGQLACAVASLKIQVKTSVGGLLPLPEVIARIPDWKKEPLDQDPAYWQYEPAARVWRGRADRTFAL